MTSTTTRSMRRAAVLTAVAGLLSAGCAWPGASSYTTPISAAGPASATPAAYTPTDAGHDVVVVADTGTGENHAAPTSEPPTPLNVAQVTFATEGADFDPCLSPDGTKIVFASTQHRATADIYAKSIEGRVVTQLTNDPADDVNPAVSPDGTRIAFASNRSGNWDVFVMPVTGGRPVQVTSDPGDELHPSWSPDGTQIVYSRLGQTSGRWEMWVTDAASQATSQFIGYGLFPQWCPVAGTGADGADRILFQLVRERGQRAFGIWTVDYKDGQASNLSELASSSWAAYINPTWSPDGKNVVFAAVPNPSEWHELARSRPSAAELWLINVDGTGRVNLTPGSSISLMPAWGAGNKLFFVASRGGVENIWSLDMTAPVRTAAGLGTAPGAPAHARTQETTTHDETIANVPEHEPGSK